MLARGTRPAPRTAALPAAYSPQRDRRPTCGFRRPRNEGEARAWLLTLARLTLIDGSISRQEQAFLRQAAQHAGLPAKEAKAAVAAARKRLYHEAREIKAQTR